jgi:hypothetical protein
MTDDPRTVAILASIDATLKKLLELSAKRSSTPAPARAQSQPRPKSGERVATDKELDDPKYGDPIVRFDPRDWTGDSHKGQPFSACNPGFLDVLAETMDYFAQQAEEKQDPNAKYKRLDAARARGWAQRIREGKTPARTDTGWGKGDY